MFSFQQWAVDFRWWRHQWRKDVYEVLNVVANISDIRSLNLGGNELKIEKDMHVFSDNSEQKCIDCDGCKYARVAFGRVYFVIALSTFSLLNIIAKNVENLESPE